MIGAVESWYGAERDKNRLDAPDLRTENLPHSDNALSQLERLLVFVCCHPDVPDTSRMQVPSRRLKLHSSRATEAFRWRKT
jgi:predicted RNA polymerase sigma factor